MAKTNRGRGRGGGARRGRGVAASSRGGRGRGRGSSHHYHSSSLGGGPTNGKKQQHNHQQPRQQTPQAVQRANRKPPPFARFRGPSDRFVEESHPQFEQVVRECYAGFRVQGAETFDAQVHDEARRAFDGLEQGGVFRADVTQPFGLGTKCALTYVTRTLVGEPGTTYKYLGLRIFSHPWTATAAARGDADGQDERGAHMLPAALRRIALLNDQLKERSRRLLAGSPPPQTPPTPSKCGGGGGGQQRGEGDRDGGDKGMSRKGQKDRREGEEEGGEGGGAFGSCEFNIALINRMEPSEDRPDLKLEPTFGQDRCSVSWHADSCLEHYSTIAVYHVTDPDTGTGTGKENGTREGSVPEKAGDWRIALRVEPDAEGPSAGKLKLAAAAAAANREVDRAPAVAVALPSRSAYFLLDDFNHHHQHAVLAGQSHRWSSTHRVAKKEGHSYDYIAGRCQTVLGDGHRRTLKQWKTEQLTLSELEFEWIRQFYVQGRAHHRLHAWWHEPLQELLRFWSLLEGRTGVVVNTLQGAAESRFDQPPSGAGGGNDDGGGVTRDGPGTGASSYDRREKKARQKRSKQKQAVESLGGRAAFSAVAEALRDRAEKRRQWAQRETDKVFDRLPADARPMPCPLSSIDAVPSPLPRDPDALDALAEAVLEWGKIFSGEDGVRGGGIASSGAAAVSKEAAAAAAAVAAKDGAIESGGAAEAIVGKGNLGEAKVASVPGGADRALVEEDGRKGPPAEGRSGSDSEVAGGTAPARSGDGAIEASGSGNDGEHGDADGPAEDRRPSIDTSGRGTAPPTPTGAGATKLPLPPSPPWKTGRFALEIQAPWARRLLDGEKTVETRAYPLPAALVGRPIEIMESRQGRDGVSSVGDTVEAFSEGLSVVGRVVFSGTEAYPSREAWAADAARHLVPLTGGVPAPAVSAPSSSTSAESGSGGGGADAACRSQTSRTASAPGSAGEREGVEDAEVGDSGGGEGKGYGWKGPGSVHGWTVGSVEAYRKPRAVRRMERAFRSLFLVEQSREKQRPGAGGGGSVAGGEGAGSAQEGDGLSGDGGGDVEGRGGVVGGDAAGKRKKKLKKKRKRKGQPGGDGRSTVGTGGANSSSGVGGGLAVPAVQPGGEQDASTAEHHTAACTAPADVDARESPAATAAAAPVAAAAAALLTGRPQRGTDKDEKKKRKRPRVARAGGDREPAVVAMGRDSVSDSLEVVGGGGGGRPRLEGSSGGATKRESGGGGGSAGISGDGDGGGAARSGGKRDPEGEAKNRRKSGGGGGKNLAGAGERREGSEDAMIAALAAAAAAARGTGDGFGGDLGGEGEHAAETSSRVGSGGGDAGVKKRGSSKSKNRSGKKKKRY